MLNKSSFKCGVVMFSKSVAPWLFLLAMVFGLAKVEASNYPGFFESMDNDIEYKPLPSVTPSPSLLHASLFTGSLLALDEIFVADEPHLLPQIADEESSDSSDGLVNSEIQLRPIVEKADWYHLTTYLKNQIKTVSKAQPLPHVLLLDLDKTTFTFSPMHLLYMRMKDRSLVAQCMQEDSLIERFINGMKQATGIQDFSAGYYMAYVQKELREFDGRAGTDIPHVNPYIKLELMDRKIPVFLKELSDRGFVILGYTAREARNYFQAADRTERELLDVGVSFAQLNKDKNLAPLNFQEFYFETELPYTYQNYIFYMGRHKKNHFLPIIAQMMHIWFPQSNKARSFHVDDTYAQLQVLPSTFDASRQAISYLSDDPFTLEHNRIHFNIDVGGLDEEDIQYLLNHKKFVNDVVQFMNSFRISENGFPNLPLLRSDLRE